MIENNQIYDTVIIGSGPAGLTAGIYNVRAALKTVVIAGNQPGGQLTITTTVDNFPGFPNGVGGVKLMMDTQTQFKNLGGEIRQGSVKKIQTPFNSHLKKGDFEIELEDGTKLQTKAVIVATGAKQKWLELAKEKELIGHGVSGCATCDGMFFREKTVAVVGGSDTACEESDFLTKFANKVYLIHRRDQLRAQASQQKSVMNNPKIEIMWNTEVVEINPSPAVAGAPPLRGSGDLDKGAKLENIKIKNNKTGEEKILPVDGLFVAIGRTPETGFVKELVELKEAGQIVVGKNPEYLSMSGVPGIFAAGDCVNDIHRQGIIAAGDGAKAGLDAEKWLKTRD
jgi:thioredoxin reductase (NADPH)